MRGNSSVFVLPHSAWAVFLGSCALMLAPDLAGSEMLHQVRVNNEFHTLTTVETQAKLQVDLFGQSTACALFYHETLPSPYSSSFAFFVADQRWGRVVYAERWGSWVEAIGRADPNPAGISDHQELITDHDLMIDGFAFGDGNMFDNFDTCNRFDHDDLSEVPWPSVDGIPDPGSRNAINTTDQLGVHTVTIGW